MDSVGGGGSSRNVSLIVGLPSAKRHWICERLEPTLDISLIKQTKGSAKHHHEHWDVKLVDRTQGIGNGGSGTLLFWW